MANIVKLGKRPAHFKEISVAITLPDGTDAVIPVTFKYKTKPEFGAWQDSVIGAKPDAPKPAEPEKVADEPDAEKKVADAPKISWEQMYVAAGDRSAEILLDIIHAWGLDVPLSKDAILELEADCGAGAIPALFEAFGKACREGRLGN